MRSRRRPTSPGIGRQGAWVHGLAAWGGIAQPPNERAGAPSWGPGSRALQLLSPLLLAVLHALADLLADGLGLGAPRRRGRGGVTTDLFRQQQREQRLHDVAGH